MGISFLDGVAFILRQEFLNTIVFTRKGILYHLLICLVRVAVCLIALPTSKYHFFKIDLLFGILDQIMNVEVLILHHLDLFCLPLQVLNDFQCCFELLHVVVDIVCNVGVLW